MFKPKKAASLLTKYRNEDPHTRYVAGLVENLLEQLPDLDWTSDDRMVLSAAAHLHDLGYAENPARHALCSAEILLKEGIPGFSKKDIEKTAAVVMLHQRDTTEARRTPLVSSFPEGSPVFRMAALLRVADGLDHGHVQNSSVRSVKKDSGRVVVKVHSPVYHNNVPWAKGKMDLWQEVMPYKLDIREQKIKTRDAIFQGLFTVDEHLLNGIRKLLFVHFRLMQETRFAYIEKRDPMALHDLRVSLRRFRVALRVFRDPLPGAQTGQLNRRFSAFQKQLGAARDSDAVLELLQKPFIARKLAQDAETPHLEQLERRRETYREEAVEMLAADSSARLFSDTARFLRITMPQLLRDAPESVYLSEFAADRMKGLFKRLKKYEEQLVPDEPETLHGMRRKLRRERYWAEFFASIFGKTAEGLARHIKSCVDHLGDIHDVDVVREHLDEVFDKPHPALESLLGKRRERSIQKFRVDWGRLRGPEFKKPLLKELKDFQ